MSSDAGWTQRFCTHCGRKMVPYYPSLHNEWKWLKCPMFFLLNPFMFDHDKLIIGRADTSASWRYDPITGERK